MTKTKEEYCCTIFLQYRCARCMRIESRELRKKRDELESLLTQLRASNAGLREALVKLMNGPGNQMAGWKMTWAHQYAKEAIEKWGKK